MAVISGKPCPLQDATTADGILGRIVSKAFFLLNHDGGQYHRIGGSI